ncbi:MAG: DUF374 domain-containing protein [Aquabacterium sp.]|nr:DUF374 domain-containing protein [Aquabacterium sp.]
MRRWTIDRFITLYGYLVAALFFLAWRFLQLTVRVRHVNQPADFGHVHTVDCAWHDGLMPYFVGGMPYTKRYVWMNHPAWYMKGIHVFLKWVGVRELVLGSSGHGGRRALQALVPLIKQGASTFLNPDGPYGPAHEVKDGVLDLAQQTGAPIVAIRIHCHRAWRAPTWDGKQIPVPGSRISLIYSPPWLIDAGNRESVRKLIKQHLDGHTLP